ncbi:hypothetical protein LTS10_012206 [Elasticomyces elasticus]|nr:hypothetical protein LTS10_012206 [Elasticomyces elasticus]
MTTTQTLTQVPLVEYVYVGHTNARAITPACASGCPICSTQFRSPQSQHAFGKYSGSFTDEEAGDTIKRHLRGTTDNLRKIRKHLDSHGDTLAKRWTKYPVPKRASIIREAASDISQSDCLQEQVASAMEKQKVDGAASSLAPRQFWLLAGLSVQILSEDPTRLLAVLLVRTQEPQEQLLILDLERTKVAFVECFVETNYNPGCVVVCPEAGHVGKRVAFESSQVHRGDTVGFPRAELAFEAGYELSAAMLAIITMVLANECGEASGRSVFNVRAEQALATTTTRLCYDERMFTMSPPSTGVLDRLIDPAYLRHKFAEIQAKPYLQRVPRVFRDRHLVQMLIDAIGDVSRADWITERILETVEVLRSYGQGVRRGRPLPRIYDEALGKLRSLLEAYYSTYQHGLLRHMAHNSAFQSSFSWSSEETQYGMRTAIRLPTAHKPKRSEDALFWNILQLSDADPDELTCDRNFHLSYINELVRSEEQRDRLDQSLLDNLSLMTTINDAINELARHLPYGSGLGRDLCIEGLEPTQSYLRVAHDICDQAPGLLKELMQAPLPRAMQNSETLCRLQGLHTAAARFWINFIGVYVNLPYNACQLKDPNVSYLSGFRDPQYLANVQAECDRLKASIQQKEQASQHGAATKLELTQSHHAPQTVWGDDSALNTTVSSGRKQITKATSEKADVSESKHQLQHALRPSLPMPIAKERIAVSAYSLTVFRLMYKSYGEADSIMKWEKFVAVLIEAGLSVKPTGGSKFRFSHPSKGSLTLHRPHPGPDVSLIWLRGYGKRLAKWFGWDEETFVAE